METLGQAVQKGWQILKPFQKNFLLTFGLLMAIEALSLAAPFLAGSSVNAVQAHEPISKALLLAVFMLLALLLGTLLMNKKDLYELYHTDFRVFNYLTNETLSKILGLSMEQHRSQSSGITRSVVSKGQDSFEQITNIILYNVLPIAIRTLIAIILLVIFDWRIGLMVAVGSLWYLKLSLDENKRSWPKIKHLWDSYHDIDKHYTEILENVDLIQSNVQEERVGKEHSGRIGIWSSDGRDVWIPFCVRGVNKNLITIFIRFYVLVAGIILLYRGRYGFGDVMIVVAWTNQATAELWRFGQLQRQLLDQWAKVKKYFTILDLVPNIKLAEKPIALDDFRGNIEFRNVSFTYSNERYVELEEEERPRYVDSKPLLPALVDVNLSISAGQRVAVVGESGAGKSTLVFLLLRGADPNSGEILIDGHDLKMLDHKHYRESIGLVEQNISLLGNTLRYNMLFGLNGASHEVTEEDMRAIAEASRIDRFEHRLTEGWDTFIGENGIKLSGGERQRVGIARALIKNPKLLILDEATSNLDPVNERAIKEAIQTASEGRTTIIIAHRLSTVRDVDKIFVMDSGKVVAEGKHDELLETSSVYRELVRDQLVHL